MNEVSTDRLAWAWTQQRIWSLTANRLKQRIDRARSRALGLGITAAALAVAATQVTDLTPAAGRTLAAAAAISAGLGTMSQRRAGTDQIRDWTRARSASEALKSEVYAYLAGGTTYTGDNRERNLSERTRGIVEDVTELQRHTLGLTPDGKPLPAVSGVETYLTQRVNNQISDYYRPKAAHYDQRVRRLRRIGDTLGALSVFLAAVAASFGLPPLAAWVPVLTTAATSVVAYIAAARYDHLIIEFLRTAQRLEHLRDTHAEHPTDDNAAFIDNCEAAISIENQGWMARWATDTTT